MSCTTTCITPTASQAHCGACHVTFGGVGGFDRHRRGGRCLAPAEIGYADNGRGIYRAPIDDAARQRLANSRSRSRRGPQSAAGAFQVGRDTPGVSGRSEGCGGGPGGTP